MLPFSFPSMPNLSALSTILHFLYNSLSLFFTSQLLKLLTVTNNRFLKPVAYHLIWPFNSTLHAFDVPLFHEITCSLASQYTTFSWSFLILFAICSSFLKLTKCFLRAVLSILMTSTTVNIYCWFPWLYFQSILHPWSF